MIKWITGSDLMSYQEGLTTMEQRLELVISGHEPDTVFLFEHHEVYTAGRSYKADELLSPHNLPVVYTGRGGKFTYHGPGQRVIYPIINLNHQRPARDLKLYVRTLENWIIGTLAEFKLEAFTVPGRVGVWVKNRQGLEAKIAALGVRIKKWVAYHGIAVNINTNLNNYQGIIPCGLGDFPITSLKDLGVDATMEEFDLALKKNAPW